jgi:hypothetical protein
MQFIMVCLQNKLVENYMEFPQYPEQVLVNI